MGTISRNCTSVKKKKKVIINDTKRKLRMISALLAYLPFVFITLEMSDEFATCFIRIKAYVASEGRFIIFTHDLTCSHVVIQQSFPDKLFDKDCLTIIVVVKDKWPMIFWICNKTSEFNKPKKTRISHRIITGYQHYVSHIMWVKLRPFA